LRGEIKLQGEYKSVYGKTVA